MESGSWAKEIEPTFERRRTTVDSRDGEGTDEYLELELRKYKPYLKQRLEVIARSGRSGELAEEVEEISYYLDVMRDCTAVESHGVTRIKQYIEEIRELKIRNPIENEVGVPQGRHKGSEDCDQDDSVVGSGDNCGSAAAGSARFHGNSDTSATDGDSVNGWEVVDYRHGISSTSEDSRKSNEDNWANRSIEDYITRQPHPPRHNVQSDSSKLYERQPRGSGWNENGKGVLAHGGKCGGAGRGSYFSRNANNETGQSFGRGYERHFCNQSNFQSGNGDNQQQLINRPDWLCGNERSWNNCATEASLQSDDDEMRNFHSMYDRRPKPVNLPRTETVFKKPESRPQMTSFREERCNHSLVHSDAQSYYQSHGDVNRATTAGPVVGFTPHNTFSAYPGVPLAQTQPVIYLQPHPPMFSPTVNTLTPTGSYSSGPGPQPFIMNNPGMFQVPFHQCPCPVATFVQLPPCNPSSPNERVPRLQINQLSPSPHPIMTTSSDPYPDSAPGPSSADSRKYKRVTNAEQRKRVQLKQNPTEQDQSTKNRVDDQPATNGNNNESDEGSNEPNKPLTKAQTIRQQFEKKFFIKLGMPRGSPASQEATSRSESAGSSGRTETRALPKPTEQSKKAKVLSSGRNKRSNVERGDDRKSCTSRTSPSVPSSTRQTTTRLPKRSEKPAAEAPTNGPANNTRSKLGLAAGTSSSLISTSPQRRTPCTNVQQSKKRSDVPVTNRPVKRGTVSQPPKKSTPKAIQVLPEKSQRQCHASVTLMKRLGERRISSIDTVVNRGLGKIKIEQDYLPPVKLESPESDTSDTNVSVVAADQVVEPLADNGTFSRCLKPASNDDEMSDRNSDAVTSSDERDEIPGVGVETEGDNPSYSDE